MPGSGARGTFWAAFAALAGLAVFAIVRVDALALVDLPQHEALVAILRHWNDPTCGYPELFEIHWLTPYWLGYGFAWLLSFPFGVAAAWKIVLAAVVVAIPLAAVALVRELGGDVSWTLALFPFGFGFAAVWGFVAFLVAVPLVLLFLRLAFRYFAEPTAGRAIGSGLAAALLPVAHILGWLVAVAIFVAMAIGDLLDRRAGIRHLLRRVWPIALSLPLPLVWWWTSSRTDSTEQSRSFYLLGFDRLTELPYQLTGIGSGALATLAVVAVLAALFAAGARPAQSRLRWAPFAVIAALVLLGPNLFFGTAYLAPRFAIFLLPCLLGAVERRRESVAAPWARGAIIALSALLLCAAALRLAATARQGEGLADVLAAAPPGQRLLYLPFDRGTELSPEPLFLHSGQRYLLASCGVAEKSFARNFQLPVRYRPNAAPPLPRLVELTPQLFRWEKHGGADYGLFLVRAKSEPDAERLAGGPGRLELRAHRGRWWLYVNRARGGG